MITFDSYTQQIVNILDKFNLKFILRALVVAGVTDIRAFYAAIEDYYTECANRDNVPDFSACMDISDFQLYLTSRYNMIFNVKVTTETVLSLHNQDWYDEICKQEDGL